MKYESHVLLGILGCIILAFSGISYFVTEFRETARFLLGQYVAGVLTFLVPKGKKESK